MNREYLINARHCSGSRNVSIEQNRLKLALLSLFSMYCAVINACKQNKPRQKMLEDNISGGGYIPKR